MVRLPLGYLFGPPYETIRTGLKLLAEPSREIHPDLLLSGGYHSSPKSPRILWRSLACYTFRFHFDSSPMSVHFSGKWEEGARHHLLRLCFFRFTGTSAVGRDLSVGAGTPEWTQVTGCRILFAESVEVCTISGPSSPYLPENSN